MNKEVKYNSVQGGPFTTSQNRVNFQLPNFGVYDLSNSFINLNVRMEVEESAAAGGNGIYNVDLAWINTADADVSPRFPNVSLVKNAVLKTGNHGTIENIRRVDILKSLMGSFKTSVEELPSKSYHAADNIPHPKFSYRNSIYTDINKEGSHMSRYNKIAPVKIPLGDIWDFCYQADEFDFSKSNGLSMELELNLNRVKGVFINDIGDLGVDATALTECENLTTAGDNYTLVVKAKTNGIDESPYFVGQKILVNGTGNGGAANLVDVPTIITEINRNQTTGVITLTTEANLVTLGGGESITDVKISASVPTSVTPHFNFAEIVLVQLPKTSSSVDVIEYSTFSTEETNGNGLTDFQNMYQVEPEADAVVIAFPNADTNLCSNTDLDNYRLRLDNEDLTDRVVQYPSPLFWDRVNTTFTQMRMRLKNLLSNTAEATANYSDLYDEDLFNVEAIMAPLPQKEQGSEKMLQLNLVSGGLNKFVLYKHLPRQFKY